MVGVGVTELPEQCGTELRDARSVACCVVQYLIDAGGARLCFWGLLEWKNALPVQKCGRIVCWESVLVEQ